jgi:SAM-dependent methyltransferase
MRPIANNLLKDCKVRNHRDDLLNELILETSVVCEIGVGDGSFSQKLQSRAKSLVLIDAFAPNPKSDLGFDTIRQKLKLPIGSTKTLSVLKGDPLNLLASFPNQHFDVIYFDGGAYHEYNVAFPRLQFALSKVKIGGRLWINDYTNYDPYAKIVYGIQAAVNEIIHIYNPTVEYLALNQSNFHDIVLVRQPLIPPPHSEDNIILTCHPHIECDLFSFNDSDNEPDLELLKLLKSLIKTGHTVIDYGTGFGLYTIPISKWIGCGGHLYIHEDNDLQRHLLALNFRLNAILPNQIQELNANDILELPASVNFIKVYADGQESTVFERMKSVIQRDRPIIMYLKSSTGNESNFSIENVCTGQLGYHRPYLVAQNIILLIPGHLSPLTI